MGEEHAPRHLPGHIAAALARAGEPSDSAGRPWSGRDLAGEGNPLHRFDADDGAADPGVEAALEALAADGDEESVHVALATARLFVPVVATLAEGAVGLEGFTEDKEADMALVTLSAPDGRKALPAFTSVDRLAAWHAEARPVAVFAPRAALSAVSEGAELLVLDPGAETTFVLRRPAVWALAQQRVWTPSYRDEGLVDVVGDAIEGIGQIRGVRLEPGRGVVSRARSGRILNGGGHGPELRIVLELSPGLPADSVRDIVAELNGRLAGSERFAEAVDSVEISLRSAAD
ncbi:SseB family protein [Sinomonas susongensis]|uniref:SseB family protein n=1 Tax=Sinomonas susongensis TaxID=1324851 RepID=UPI00110924C5|nr:SseB family protein [Sinomonas susongensis]